MENFLVKFQKLKNSKFFNYGMPFIVFVVGSSFALKEFTSLRYEYRKTEALDPKELLEKDGIKKKDFKEITLEKLYEKEQKEVDLNNWTNVRGPRPWEDMSDFIKLKEENQAKKKKKMDTL